MQRSPLGAAVLSLALLAAACGSDEAAPSDATEDAAVAESMAMDAGSDTTDAESEAADAASDEMHAHDDHDMHGMEMGDATATPANDVEGAALASGELVLLDTRPQGFDEAAGTAWVARHEEGTTVTVELSGLIPDADYISHLHADTCANEGGDHYQFEVGGSEMPPNEIHLAFTSDADGNGFMTVENSQTAGSDAVSFVVHPTELIDNKVGCVDFVEVEAVHDHSDGHHDE